MPQDPNDEPASELLKRIAAERTERTCVAAVAKRTKSKAGRKAGTPKGGVRRGRVADDRT